MEDFKETVMAEHTADIVNEPKHYARWKIEPYHIHHAEWL